jgi:hypothetical protein
MAKFFGAYMFEYIDNQTVSRILEIQDEMVRISNEK